MNTTDEALSHQVVLRMTKRQAEILQALADMDDRSRSYVLRGLIDKAGAKLPASHAMVGHRHTAKGKNALKLDYCECGAVLGKDFEWRMP